MKDYTREGKWDVGYTDDDGWHHVCRYSDEEEAHDARERLEDPSDEERNLIGLTGDEDMEVRPAS
jgi:hypothetical protein